MYIEVRPYTCEVQGVEMLKPADGLCCIAFINLIGVVAGVRRERLSVSIRKI
jgi:hypothetical protein